MYICMLYVYMHTHTHIHTHIYIYMYIGLTQYTLNSNPVIFGVTPIRVCATGGIRQ